VVSAPLVLAPPDAPHQLFSASAVPLSGLEIPLPLPLPTVFPAMQLPLTVSEAHPRGCALCCGAMGLEYPRHRYQGLWCYLCPDHTQPDYAHCLRTLSCSRNLVPNWLVPTDIASLKS